MAVSRVVKLSHLSEWIEQNAYKTFCTKETVDKILEVITKENVELTYETSTADYVFIRIEQVVKNALGVLPWSHSGGSLTVPNPLTQIGVMRFNALKGIDDIKNRHVEYNDPSITIVHSPNSTTLTINTSCEF